MAEYSDPDFVILMDAGLFSCIIFKTSDIERSSHPVHSDLKHLVQYKGTKW